MRQRLLAFVVFAVVGCRAPAAGPKEAPFDFSVSATPAASAFGSQGDLLARWSAGSLSSFWASGESTRFVGVGGKTLGCVIFHAVHSKASVVVLPGRTEALIKYAEVAYDLVQQGYSVFLLDLRGQGSADRLLADPQKGYVEYFDDYVTDTHLFIENVVAPQSTRVVMFAHSLGGGVASALNDAWPQDVSALVLSSPMLEIDLGAFAPTVAASLAFSVCDSSDGTGYTLGAGPYARETDFATNTVTHSEPRWAWKLAQLDADPSLQLGGVTWRWLCQALEGSSRASSSGRFNATPTLLFQAGADTIVKPQGQKKFCDDSPHCTLEVVDGARHELLQETDDLRNEALAKAVKFLDVQVQR
jgi:lysophospholipase